MVKLPDCPFCFSAVQIVHYEQRLRIRCSSNCPFNTAFEPMVGDTEQELAEAWDKFLLELKLGADVWGSKIDAGLDY